MGTNYHRLTGSEYWERLPHETAKGYEAFQLYRDQGRRRSQKKVCEKLGKCARLIQGWADKFHWLDRAIAFDARMDEEMAETNEIMRKEMSRRHSDFTMALQSLLAQRLKTINPDTITFGQLTYALDVAQRLERLARGLPDAEVQGTKVEFIVHSPSEIPPTEDRLPKEPGMQ